MKKKKEKITPNKKMRKGDTVMAIRGNEKGQTGTVLSRIENRVLVQGLNMKKKHVKKSENNPSGGIIEIEKPIHISNLRVCVDNDVPVKLHTRTSEKGVKELYYMKDGKQVLYRAIKGQK